MRRCAAQKELTTSQMLMEVPNTPGVADNNGASIAAFSSCGWSWKLNAQPTGLRKMMGKVMKVHNFTMFFRAQPNRMQFRWTPWMLVLSISFRFHMRGSQSHRVPFPR